MIFHAAGKILRQVIPKFPPTSEDDVDFLLNLKVRVLIMLSLLRLLSSYMLLGSLRQHMLLMLFILSSMKVILVPFQAEV